MQRLELTSTPRQKRQESAGGNRRDPDPIDPPRQEKQEGRKHSSACAPPVAAIHTAVVLATVCRVVGINDGERNPTTRRNRDTIFLSPLTNRATHCGTGDFHGRTSATRRPSYCTSVLSERGKRLFQRRDVVISQVNLVVVSLERELNGPPSPLRNAGSVDVVNEFYRYFFRHTSLITHLG